MDSREMRPCWLLESINLFIRKMHRHQHPMHMKILRTMKQLLDILLDSLRLNMTKHKHACFQQTDINNIITSQLQPLFLMENHDTIKVCKNAKTLQSTAGTSSVTAELPAFNGDKGGLSTLKTVTGTRWMEPTLRGGHK